MGNEATPDSQRQPEADSSYAEVSNATLIDRYIESEGEAGIGQELAVRIFDHAGFTEDSRTTPLIGKDGQQVRHFGKPLFLADYVNFAAEDHFEALEGMFDFLGTKPGEPAYEGMKSMIFSWLTAGQRS